MFYFGNSWLVFMIGALHLHRMHSKVELNVSNVED
jgi:hypothetical protein